MQGISQVAEDLSYDNHHVKTISWHANGKPHAFLISQQATGQYHDITTTIQAFGNVTPQRLSSLKQPAFLVSSVKCCPVLDDLCALCSTKNYKQKGYQGSLNTGTSHSHKHSVPVLRE